MLTFGHVLDYKYNEKPTLYNQMSYSNRTIQNNINSTESTHDEQQPKHNPWESKQEHIKEWSLMQGRTIIKYSKVNTV